jgi:hypothetical protein
MVPIRGFPQLELVLTYPHDREDGMRRREFIAGLGSAAAWPVVGAGGAVMPRICPMSSQPLSDAELDKLSDILTRFGATVLISDDQLRWRLRI